MITGKEKAFPSTDGNMFAHGGLTIKQHMVIEFTKSGLATHDGQSDVNQKFTEQIVREAIMVTKEVIKQLNEDEHSKD